MEPNNTQEAKVETVSDQDPKQVVAKQDPLKILKGQISNGPLPKAIDQLKAEWRRNKWLVVLGLTTLVLIVVLILGLIGGAIVGALTTKSVDVPDLPSISPTERPRKTSIFDPLRQEIIDFTTILPDPAPPAVDQNINLDAKKN